MFTKSIKEFVQRIRDIQGYNSKDYGNMLVAVNRNKKGGIYSIYLVSRNYNRDEILGRFSDFDISN